MTREANQQCKDFIIIRSAVNAKKNLVYGLEHSNNEITKTVNKIMIRSYNNEPIRRNQFISPIANE
jgi:hypothetical protein